MGRLDEHNPCGAPFTFAAPSRAVKVEIVPWGIDDEPLLHALLGDPAMMTHLHGPESPEKIAARHRRYLAIAADPRGGTFKILVDGQAAGWVGYWESSWAGEPAFELGWSVLPAFQGHGVATAATRLALARLREDGRFRVAYAFPAVENAPSNALCRKLGFEDRGVVEVEWPKGHTMRSIRWRLAW